MAITRYKVIQGHQFQYQWKAIYYFLCVNNSNLHPILHCFWDMADYWSNFRTRQGMRSYDTLIGGDPLNMGGENLALSN